MKIRLLRGADAVVGEEAAVTVAEDVGDGGHGDERLSEPALAEAVVIHRCNRCVATGGYERREGDGGQGMQKEKAWTMGARLI